MLELTRKLRPPAPEPRTEPLGPIALLRVLLNNPLEAWTEAHFQKPIVTMGLSIGRVAVVSEPNAIRRVLLDNAGNYKKDWLQRRVMSAGLTKGLLSAEGNQWRMQRRALAPMFTPRSVATFAAPMAQAAQAMVARLRAQEGKVVDLAVELTRTTLDVLERTIFSDGLGRDAEDIRKGMRVYFESVGRIDPFDMLGVPNAIPRFTRFGIGPAMRLFAAAIDTVIAKRRRRIADNPNAAPHDILTLLLKAEDPHSGRRLSEQEVRANVLTFIAAGHETTANCLTWASFLLSQSPEWHERVQSEADREAGSDARNLADRLVETRAVIDETNRLYPPIAAISRVALGPDQLAGERISRGTIVVIAPYVLHRHRSLWHRPDEFDPNRFLGGAREHVGRFAYLPFGAGPRVCIGAGFALQEASIVLATLLRNFSLVLSPKHSVWPVQKFTVRPKDGLPMILQPRA